PAGPYCVAGRCLACAAEKLCGGRCDVNLLVDAANCGTCGHVCGAGQSCSGGRCFTPAWSCPPPSVPSCPHGIELVALPPQPAGVAPIGAAVADFHGDGRPDLAIAGKGGVFVLSNRGDGSFAAPVQIALPADATAVAVGDIDGDGKPDILAATANGI